jgi:hypothetical protein
MRASSREQFRWVPHTSGVSTLKPRDFEPAGEVEAASVYEAWAALRGTERALLVGDVLESGSGELRICKYVGFEEAQWFVPEALAAAANQTPLEMARPSA